MCGIVAIVDPTASPDARAEAAARMLARMRHRGPNDQGVFSAGDLTLGMVRLSILDVSDDGHQPMFNETGDVVVVYNGEIYNFQELRDALRGHGHTFRSRTDTEVLLHGYEQWGIDGLLGRLNGMYAFALHDTRSRTTYIARDRIGIKPLYVHRTGSRLLCASEVHTLLAHPGLTPELGFLAMRLLSKPPVPAAKDQPARCRSPKICCSMNPAATCLA
jgi:asparagine synthase (glutamine-hydrolysing)